MLQTSSESSNLHEDLLRSESTNINNVTIIFNDNSQQEWVIF